MIYFVEEPERVFSGGHQIFILPICRSPELGTQNFLPIRVFHSLVEPQQMSVSVVGLVQVMLP